MVEATERPHKGQDRTEVSLCMTIRIPSIYSFGNAPVKVTEKVLLSGITSHAL
jgi:hypothetical protein